jgi:CDP-glucose 4,6-dehydratase
MESMVMHKKFWCNKRVVITGHTGFKGSWLAAWLQLWGAEIIGVSLKPDTQPNHFAALNLDLASHFIDIRDKDKLLTVFKKTKPDIVFHLAAQPLVRASYVNPLYTFETNVMGTANVLNACRELESLQAAIVITSDKCYENKEWDQGYKEIDPMGGHDPYSASKGSAELVVASFRNSYFHLDKFGQTHDTLIASARAGNVIGGGDWAEDRLIPDIVRAIANGETVKIRNPQATRPWQHVLDCLSGYICLGEKLLAGEKQFAEAWNFASTDDETATVLDIVQKMQKSWPKMRYEIEQQRGHHPHEANLLKLDCSKAQSLLSWKNIWSLEQMIAMTTSWYRNFYEKNTVLTLDDINTYLDDSNLGEK